MGEVEGLATWTSGGRGSIGVTAAQCARREAHVAGAQEVGRTHGGQSAEDLVGPGGDTSTRGFE